jgi:multiple RNA-binding domain-containing protein 1
LDGHALILQLSHAKDSVAKTTPGKSSVSNESSTKLIVRNVAFEATKKDLQQLFSPFGQVSSNSV